jgi:hypothetical protein
MGYTIEIAVIISAAVVDMPLRQDMTSTMLRWREKVQLQWGRRGNGRGAALQGQGVVHCCHDEHNMLTAHKRARLRTSMSPNGETLEAAPVG